MTTGVSQSFVTEGEEVTGAAQAPASSSSHSLAQFLRQTLRTLYVFAGEQRKADLQFFLEVLQGPGGVILFMKEVDLLRGSDQDVADDDFWDALMKVLDSGEFDLVVITPPCYTHSRPRTRKKTSKPTCLMSDLARASEEPFQGLPFFDGSARYFGPLPHVCPHGGHKDQLNGKRKDGMGFKTSDSASYTAGMCF